MSRKEVEDSKHRVAKATPEKPKKPQLKFVDGFTVTDNTAQPVEFHYKERGQITEDTNSSYAMKKKYPAGNTEYFIKFGTAGPGVGKMLNPWGFYYREGDEAKYEAQMGRKTYEFLRVSEETFISYLKFLETRNERYILSAQREVNDGR